MRYHHRRLYWRFQQYRYLLRKSRRCHHRQNLQYRRFRQKHHHRPRLLWLQTNL
jgi:hypothetical protein